MKIKLGGGDKNDIPALAKYANNMKVWKTLKDIFPHPYTIKDAGEWIILNKHVRPATNFAIRVDGKMAGGTVVIIKDDIYCKNAEIDYWLGEPFWGKGIATEVVAQLTSYAFANFDVIRIYAAVFSNNPVSMKVLEKNGYKEESIHQKAIFKNNQLSDAHLWVKFRDE